MKISNLTWLGFFMTLSSLAIAPKTLAINANNIINSADISENIETRLSRISQALKAREKDLSENGQNYPDNQILLGRFLNGGGGWVNFRRGGWGDLGRGSFLNRRGGPGGFLNNRGGGGFLNRGWRDGGGFLNRRW